MDSKEILENASEIAMKADGFDEAIIGLTSGGLVAYSYEKCVEMVMEDCNIEYIDALEYVEFNVVGSYVGEGTPIFIITNG